MPTNAIRVVGTVRDDVLYVDLADPARRNAIDEAFAEDLTKALGDIESVRAVVLSSRGADFCVGAMSVHSPPPTSPRLSLGVSRRACTTPFARSPGLRRLSLPPYGDGRQVRE